MYFNIFYQIILQIKIFPLLLCCETKPIPITIMKPFRQATIKDIARELGISASTVSRALKDHPDISPETKEAVRSVADKLDYQPNALALGLHNQRSKIIGIIIPEIRHHFFSSVISSITETARNAGFNVIICPSDESVEREKENIRSLVSLRVEGILISITKETNDYTHFQKLMNRNVPVVFFDRPPEGFACDRCIIDDYAAAYTATEHLVSLGRKKIVHFAGPNNVRIGKDRRRGFVDCLKRHKMPITDDTIFDCDSHDKAVEVIKKLRDEDNIPDAIFAVNDITAVTTVNELNKYGIRVPEKVAVVGFTNGLLSELSSPMLTTIDQNGQLIGEKATKLLLERIETHVLTPYQTAVVPTKLVVRGSTVAEDNSDLVDAK